MATEKAVARRRCQGVARPFILLSAICGLLACGDSSPAPADADLLDVQTYDVFQDAEALDAEQSDAVVPLDGAMVDAPPPVDAAFEDAAAEDASPNDASMADAAPSDAGPDARSPRDAGPPSRDSGADTAPPIDAGMDTGSPVGSFFPLYASTTERLGLSIGSNSSGVTYNPRTGTLFVIRNGSAVIHEVFFGSGEFLPRRVIHLSNIPGSTDTEDIVYVGEVGDESEFAIVTEHGTAAIGVIPDDATSIDVRTWQRIVYADRPPVSNKGGEGIAFDPATNRFWVCIEQSPMRVYTFERPVGNADYREDLVVTEPFDAQSVLTGSVGDISSCLHDPRTNRLAILSQVSSRIVDITLSGDIIEIVDIEGPRAEGITLFERSMWIVSEPDVIQHYEY